MPLSIVLPCAVDDGIDRCIRSIDERVEVVAVLNRPTLSARVGVSRLGLRVVEVGERNLGLACDMGVEAATNDLVLMMNSDCWFGPGTIRTILKEWSPGNVITTSVRYEGRNLRSRIIEQLQASQSENPPQAYQPGLLFDRRIRADIGGYWFDHDIHWTEDADFHRRVVAAGMNIRLASAPAVIWHRQPSISKHLRSAFRYGIGRRIAEEKNLFGTSPNFRWSPSLIVDEFKRQRQESDPLVGAYSALWLSSFSCGVAWQRMFDVYGTRARREQLATHPEGIQ